jgi:hypothetical protein
MCSTLSHLGREGAVSECEAGVIGKPLRLALGLSLGMSGAITGAALLDLVIRAYRKTIAACAPPGR